MNLRELYNYKLKIYKETGIREKPSKLLALLLLENIDKFDFVRVSEIEFYEMHKDEFNKYIEKVENDFNIDDDYINKYIGETIEYKNYDSQRILFIYSEGFGALHYGIKYFPDKSGEEIYSKYFETNELNLQYDLEQLALANDINMTSLNVLLENSLENPIQFYKNICNNLNFNEKSFILGQLKNKSCENCNNESCNIKQHEKLGINKKETEIDNCIGWYNSELIGKSRVLRKNDINKLI